MSQKPNPPLTPEEAERLLYLSTVEGHTASFPEHSRRWLTTERDRLRQEATRAAGLEGTLPFHLKGVSTLYGAGGREGGDIKALWWKTDRTREEVTQAVLAAIPDLMADYPRIPRVTQSRAPVDTEQLAVYPMGDPHIGLLNWAESTGVAWDLEKAELSLVKAVDKLVRLAPRCEHALIAGLGDFFHYDNKRYTTTKGTLQKPAGTWTQMLEVGVRTMRRSVDRALQKHKTVHLINAIGNHDELTSVVLSMMMAEAYSDNPRVTVETSDRGFHYHRFGQVLIGITHGKRSRKPEELAAIMAADRPEDWGQTKFRYWFVGHVHHISRKEVPGCIVESFRSLTPHDEWHLAHGFRGERDMKCILMHKEHGEILRHTVGVSML